jgi:hypothetical protein
MQLAVIWQAVDTPEQFEAAFATIARERSNALLMELGVATREQLARCARLMRQSSRWSSGCGKLRHPLVPELLESSVFVRS